MPATAIVRTPRLQGRTHIAPDLPNEHRSEHLVLPVAHACLWPLRELEDDLALGLMGDRAAEDGKQRADGEREVDR